MLRVGDMTSARHFERPYSLPSGNQHLPVEAGVQEDNIHHTCVRGEECQAPQWTRCLPCQGHAILVGDSKPEAGERFWEEPACDCFQRLEPSGLCGDPSALQL